MVQINSKCNAISEAEPLLLNLELNYTICLGLRFLFSFKLTNNKLMLKDLRKSVAQFFIKMRKTQKQEMKGQNWEGLRK